jgi:hypothetical protein
VGYWLWCFTPLSTIFQLYRARGSQFYEWRKPEYPKKPPTCRKLLTHFIVITKCCIEHTSPWTGFELTTDRHWLHRLLVPISTGVVSSKVWSYCGWYVIWIHNTICSWQIITSFNPKQCQSLLRRAELIVVKLATFNASCCRDNCFRRGKTLAYFLLE